MSNNTAKISNGNLKNLFDLSICIVNWNGAEVLRECLGSIYKYSENLSIEIFVIDNASEDKSISLVREEFPEVVLIQNNINKGFGRANNQAIKRCRGEYILILNPDIIVKKPSFRIMLEYLRQHPDAGCLACKLVNPDGSIQKSYYHTFPTPISELKQGILINRISKSLLRYKYQPDKPQVMSWVAGACMLFRRDTLNSLNGFDEQYFMYGEDIDICYRIKKMGYKVIYLGNLEMIHHHAFVSSKKSKKYFSPVLQRESVYKFMKSHYSFLTLFLYRFAWFISSIIRLMLIIPPYLISCLTLIGSRKRVSIVFEKYYRILLWSLGFEKWTRQYVPD